ncbi:MAG: electron-transferring-flavoprotein dehydrogenase [Acidobacteriota bacterium]|jgi:electron-transferring-flavoprotein dehydrogenase|nr:electron-transferring-flavoprotein dehydrogenase [Acidobacteriota bacterium]
MSDERETLEMDVVFVGAGPASLAGAYHLARLAKAAGRELSIGVLEKGREITSHALSGAVVDPRALKELFPEDWRDAPFEGRIEHEKFLFLTSGKALSLPIPPPLENEGNYVASLGKLLRWMAPRVEAAGVDIFFEFPAVQALMEDGRVVGVRTGDKGISRHGEKKANYEPGVDIRAQVVVLGEGPRGTLVKQLDAELDLWQGKNPQIYAIGLKEVWDVPHGRIEPGQVIHTLGWPLDFHTFGGGFVYGMQNDQAIAGIVVGLDYRNPLLDPHQEFQRFKTHPAIAPLLAGGKMAFYGAKAIPEGGWWSMPRVSGDGFLIVGDSAGMLNSQRLKGIHLGMKSGMLAAETIFEALQAGGATAERLATYQGKIEASWIKEELWEVRNFHQAFDHGVLAGMIQAGAGLVTGGRGWGIFDRVSTEAGHQRMIPLNTPEGQRLKAPEPVKVDNQLTFDKLADVYNSGTAHDEDQPVHLLVADTDICIFQCAVEYANPCQRFCPAAVYEMVPDPASPTGERLQINASNCVHCKTCDIMDPYQIITWVPPEGGDGPNYSKM